MRIAILIFSLSHMFAFGQSFQNSDFEGTSGAYSSGVLPNWSPIPSTDPISQANMANFSDTPDVTDELYPAALFGSCGAPYSGNTFLSALHSSTVQCCTTYHEGVKQLVSGFVPGDQYEIRLYQSIVKQKNCLDQSGSWAVYCDDILIGITTPSFSSLAFDDINLIWEERTLNFEASNTDHVIKFISYDDDTDLTSSYDNEQGALRMGIDNLDLIHLTNDSSPDNTENVDNLIYNLQIPNVITANNDGINDEFVPIINENVAIRSVIILNRWGNIIHKAESFDQPWSGWTNGRECVEGTYFWFIEYTDIQENIHSDHGSVTLLR